MGAPERGELSPQTETSRKRCESLYGVSINIFTGIRSLIHYNNISIRQPCRSNSSFIPENPAGLQSAKQTIVKQTIIKKSSIKKSIIKKKIHRLQQYSAWLIQPLGVLFFQAPKVEFQAPTRARLFFQRWKLAW